ncbi:MAG: amidohydrolase family protein [Pyrinomonadaceae bacterium]|nr:amidohydrolase family protein [Pyrinomonadaceae bacterium]
MKLRITNYELRITNLLALWLVLLLCGLTVNAQLNSGALQNNNGKAGTFVIKNARIVTVSGAVIESGTVVIKDGKIAAVGATAAAPSGAEVIDGRGLSVYPGMIDAATNLGLIEIGLGAPGTVDTNELGDNNANEKAIIAVNPYSAFVNVSRNIGVTTVLTKPQSGLISGQSAVINLVGSTPGEMAVSANNALIINFPRVVAGFGGGFGGFGGPAPDFNELVRRRDTAVDGLKKTFKEALEYGRLQDAYAKDKTLPKPKTDLRMAAMVPFVRGEKPIIFSAERERDIKAVIKFADEMKVKAIILGGQEASKAATELKQKSIPVIFTNIYNLPVREDDAYDAFFAEAGKLQKAGVLFCIATDSETAVIRDLPEQAGIAAAFDLPKEEALKAVTLYPAQILGVADKLGSIEVGKIANIVVTDGDMLEARTKVKYLFINGRLLPLTSRHTELYEQFKDRKPNQ